MGGPHGPGPVAGSSQANVAGADARAGDWFVAAAFPPVVALGRVEADEVTPLDVGNAARERRAECLPSNRMPQPWHSHGMARTRVSTTVDHDLLEEARSRTPGLNDAALLDAALDALVARHRSAEVDASYLAYDQHPLDEPDEWGDLASFRDAAGAS